MNRKLKIAFWMVLSLVGIGLSIFYFTQLDLVVLNPKGMIAVKEKKIFHLITLLMLIIVIPTLILTFAIAWRYREGNAKAKYAPDWERDPLAEWIWWGLPCVIVFAISLLCWKGCRELDPFKALSSDRKPIQIQVVALQWKWLFIYPEQKIATVNFIQIPEKTPIEFEITADAPMNSFWIPQLGGQIYAMPGMRAKLHLIADEEGSFRGSSANLSGKGFSGMTFVAKASSEADFNAWVESVGPSSPRLGRDEYALLAEPSENNSVAYYSLEEGDLYERIVMKYMGMDGATSND